MPDLLRWLRHLVPVLLLSLALVAIGAARASAWAPAPDGPVVDIAAAGDGASDGPLELVDAMQALREPLAALSSDTDVLRRPGWQPATVEHRNGSWMRSAVWLTGRVRNGSDQPLTRWIVVTPWRIEQIALLVLGDDGTDAVLSRSTAGRAALLSPQWNGHVESVFPVTLAPGQTVRLLIRLQDLTVPTSFVHAWSPLAYQRHQTLLLVWQAMLAACVGVVLAGLVASRDRGLLLMGAWLLVAVGFESTFRGQWLFYLWPGLAAWQIPLFSVFGALGYTGFLLASRFLLGMRRSGLLAWLINGCCALSLLAGLSTLFVEDHLLSRRIVSTLGIASVALWLVRGLAHPAAPRGGGTAEDALDADAVAARRWRPMCTSRAGERCRSGNWPCGPMCGWTCCRASAPCWCTRACAAGRRRKRAAAWNGSPFTTH